MKIKRIFKPFFIKPADFYDVLSASMCFARLPDPHSERIENVKEQSQDPRLE